jgi:hypothetical protein
LQSHGQNDDWFWQFAHPKAFMHSVLFMPCTTLVWFNQYISPLDGNELNTQR